MSNLRWWLSTLDLDEPLPPGLLFVTGAFLLGLVILGIGVLP